MKGTLKKLSSAILVIVLLFQLLPLSVFAENASRNSATESDALFYSAAESEIREYSADDILYEDESLRTETEKHFVLSGGTSIAVS